LKVCLKIVGVEKREADIYREKENKIGKKKKEGWWVSNLGHCVIFVVGIFVSQFVWHLWFECKFVVVEEKKRERCVGIELVARC
jgi:hypothetical protein